MFIERSADRIRLVRTAFVLVGLLPFAVLAAWAAWRHSAGHLEAVRRECEQAIGLPLEIGGIEHLRPHGFRLRSCSLLSPGGTVMATVPVVDVDSSAAEVRLRLPRLECTPEAARALAAVARGWLHEPVRHSRAWIIDVEDFQWPTGSIARPYTGPPATTPPVGLHVECVAAEGTRAIRVRRDPRSADEVRVRSTFIAGMAAERLEVSGSVAEPLPAAAVAALVGSPLGDGLASLGANAKLRGVIEAVCDGGRWSGRARGRVEQVDLAACTALLPHRIAGEATLSVPVFEWDSGRVTECRLECTAAGGEIGQGLLDALVTVLGCRAGPAYRSLAGEPLRKFDELAFGIHVDRLGTVLRAAADHGGSLARRQGLSLLDEPVAGMPNERLAWLFPRSDSMPVPASDAGLWLMSVLPVSSMPPPIPGETNKNAGETLRALPPQAERPGRRAGF